jgi:hypothetical protein
MIDLSQLNTIVYTIERHTERHKRVEEILTRLGFVKWRFFHGTPGNPYWKPIRNDYKSILESNVAPLLVLEDDIDLSPNYTNVISVPQDTDVAYLGAGKGGDHLGRLLAQRHLRFQGREHTMKYAFGYAYESIDNEWMKLYGMLYTHANLYLTDNAMKGFARMIDTWSQVPVDVAFSRGMCQYNVVGRKQPLFWQNDGHHKEETYEYAPIEEK